MRLKDFDYPLNKELIAQAPLGKRDESRLMAVNRDTGDIHYKKFGNIIEYIDKGDLLVVNDTRVFPARIFGKKNTGGRVELLLLKRLKEPDNGTTCFSALSKSSKPLKAGSEINFDAGLKGEVQKLSGDGRIEIKFTADKDIFSILEDIGVMPLPPYIKRQGKEKADIDKLAYQTVYAENVGAVAAPTAGLHFTDELLSRLSDRGVDIARVTLHVGHGTFMPVRTEDISEHKMHEEFFSITDSCIEKVKKAKQNGKRVISVGTTSLRSLESAFDEEANLIRKEGNTNLFIYPGYRFKVVDALITNFHLPKSTLLMLVYAFGGVELIRRAYKDAVEKSFRLFSYGDAMFIY